MSDLAQLRRDLGTLNEYAERDLSVLWRDPKDPTRAEAALRDVLPALIDTYGSAASTLAAERYDDVRARTGVRGKFRAVPADIKDSGAQSLVGWALSEATDVPSLTTLILGGTQRRIANFARKTVMDSSFFDPSAQGWQRVSQGGCSTGFCDMLAGRGTVYSEASADFASHDHCQCYAEPAFVGAPRPVKPYKPSLRTPSDADRARAREWIASH